MPVHRYDRWLQTESQPPFFAAAMDVTKPPGASIERPSLSPADPVPWEECDFQRPASNVHIHFNSEEIGSLWKKATAESTTQVSQLDALLAHLWQRLSVARQLDNLKDIYQNVVLGIRPRLSPPLSNNFLGSPTMHIHTAMRPHEIIHASIGKVAEAIRSSTGRFGRHTLHTLLHNFTYEAGAQRLWQFFIGQRHTTVTTWLKLGASSLEFAGGCSPRHVHFLLPNTMDGIIKIMEAPPIQETESGNDGTTQKERGHWSDNGVIVAMVMDTTVMERLLADPLLRGK
jgi:hypothetical protein